MSVTVFNSEFRAIQYPIQWPPPELPPFPPHPLARIPVVGWPFRYFRWLRYSSRHIREVLDPIAEEIIAQLEMRPAHGPWPCEPTQKAIAAIISDAVGLEKGLTQSPALHPDDPFSVLFWGPFDDLTPLHVRVECNDKLQLKLPPNMLIDAWNQRWTIGRFIDACIAGDSHTEHTLG